jgi:hypothetical protein
MDQLSETTRRVVEILIRDWILWVAILTVVLVFALYLYFNPRATEFFTGAQKPAQKTLGELAAEDKEQSEEQIEAAAKARGSTPQPTA